MRRTDMLVASLAILALVGLAAFILLWGPFFQEPRFSDDGPMNCLRYVVRPGCPVPSP